MSNVPSDVVDALWDKYLQSRGGLIFPTTKDLLASLIGVAFYAGIGREEGHRVEASVAFMGVTHPHMHVYSDRAALVFDEPLEYTVQSVIKLALATDPDLARIGVVESGGRLLIWGLVYDDGSLERFQLGESYIGSHTASLLVRLYGPGHFAVDSDIRRLVEFRDGSILPIGLRVLSDTGPIAETLLSRCMQTTIGSQHPLLTPAGQPRRFTYLSCVRRLLYRAQRAGHGCIVAILPEMHLTSLKGGNRFAGGSELLKRAQRDGLAAETLALERATEGHSLNLSILSENDSPVWDRSDRMIAAVARLSQVDGALILGPDLSVLAFGATIEGTLESNVVACEDAAATRRSRYLISRLGHRHRAAAFLADARPGAVVFVVSQDGVAGSLLKVGADVLFWRPLQFHDVY